LVRAGNENDRSDATCERQGYMLRQESLHDLQQSCAIRKTLSSEAGVRGVPHSAPNTASTKS
jgi:hypothetical protein